MKKTRNARNSLIILSGTALVVALAAAAGASPGQQSQTAVASPPTHTGVVTRQLTTGPNHRVSLMGGVLTPPSIESPERIGQRFLATRPAVLGNASPATLAHDSTVALSRGHIVRYRQTHRGMRVIGGTTVVRIDDQGRVRWAGSGARSIPASVSATPVLTPRQAFEKIAPRFGYDAAYVDRLAADGSMTRGHELVIYTQPNMDEPRLAYWIELPYDATRMLAARALVDAGTGLVYRVENRVMNGTLPTCPAGTQRAYVYDINPVETPDLSCVSLSDYLAPGAVNLANADVATGNCVDNDGCRAVEIILPIDLHWCDDDPSARTNAAGDFTDHLFVSDTDPEDPFAEVQMFYHVNKGFDVARALGGFTDLNTRPLGAVTNFRLPFDIASGDLTGILEQTCTGGVYSGGLALHPFDNAAFVPAGGLLGYPDQDSIVFGQGTGGDFAYDGDVVYHEFGHAVMNTIAPGLGFGFLDQYGFNPQQGGMHEGYADLMTMFVTDDPEIGEYAGQFLGIGVIRNIDNAIDCPNGMIGETHIDSLPITGAIWEARQAVATTPADKTLFDEAVFAAQQTFTETEDFSTAATKTVLEIEAALGATAAAQVQAIFEARQMFTCNNRVIDGSATKDLLFVGSTGQGGGPTKIPGPVQFAYDLPGGADSITIDVAQSQIFVAGGLGGAPILSAVIKKDSEILWNVGEGTVNGDYSQEVAMPTNMGSGPATATFTGPFEPGTYYVQLMVDGGSLILQGITMSHLGGSTPPADAGPGNPDAGPGSGDGGNNLDGDESGGCGCVVGDSDSGMGSGLLLGLVALVLVRRRRSR